MIVRRFVFLLFVLAVFLPVESYAESAPATPDQVSQLLTKGSPLKSNQIAPDFISIAATQNTLRLGQGNPKWNKSNPKWDDIYEKVLDDTTSDVKPFVDYMNTKGPSEFASMMQAHLTADDANAVLSYLATEQGKDFLDFNAAVNKLMAGGAASLRDGEAPPATVTLSSDQRSNYAHMLNQSRVFQMMTIFQATDVSQSDGAVGRALAGAIVQKYPEDLAALFQKYGTELGAFSDFNRSGPERNFLSATALVTQQMGKDIMQIQYANTARAKQHQAEWTAMYQHDVLDNQ